MFFIFIEKQSCAIEEKGLAARGLILPPPKLAFFHIKSYLGLS